MRRRNERSLFERMSPKDEEKQVCKLGGLKRKYIFDLCDRSLCKFPPEIHSWPNDNDKRKRAMKTDKQPSRKENLDSKENHRKKYETSLQRVGGPYKRCGTG